MKPNLILARGDTFLYFYPYWAYRARVLLSGHLPLWNPDLFMGAPFIFRLLILRFRHVGHCIFPRKSLR